MTSSRRIIRLLPLALVVVAASSLAACGGSGGSSGGAASGPGIVSQLTGDPDDEVSATLEEQVSRALARDANDDPIPD